MEGTHERHRPAPDLGAELRRETDRARRSVRNHAVLGGAVLLLLTTWGAWLHAQVSSFGPADAAMLARVEVAAALPGARAELAAHLQKSAPDLVGHAIRSLVRAPAYLRARLETSLSAEIPAVAARLKEKLDEEIRASIRASRLALDTRHPEMDDRARFDWMARELVEGYRERLSLVSEAYANPYRTSLEDLRRRIENLSEPGVLDERERLEREILVTFLEMHARARERGEIDVLTKRGVRIPFLRDE
ncbi:MAG: hypothetical protein L0323_15355 [Planctomycetes bacterium]|nr:hypothetical protein [Planctomycetota bacterium]